jgi:SEC-C motif-containing protein
MKKPGRNDPCPCGSGKKYKQCCMKAKQTKVASDRSTAVPGALEWLLTKYGPAAREALYEGFFGGIDDDEYERLQNQHRDSFEGIMINAMEWLLADGLITIEGQERRVSDLILGRGGPLFSAKQREWIELMAAKPLGLYEVIDVVPGESMQLRDIIFPENAPVLVQEKAGSRQAVKFDLIAARVLPVDGHFELSGAVYAIPRHRSLDLITELRHELKGLTPDSPAVKELVAVIIPDYWLKLFALPFQMPQIVDHITGEPILLITDHYRVHNWEALSLALSGKADIEGNREAGWIRLFEGKDGQLRSSIRIETDKRPNRLKVSYITQKYADEGRPWFEGVAGRAVAFLSRGISDPKGMLANRRPDEALESPAPAQLPPEVMTEIIEKHIRKSYANWADQPLPALDDRTPREAIRTPEGLEQVKFLLHSYEHSEARQARDQHRAPVSYDFLWQKLGLTP